MTFPSFSRTSFLGGVILMALAGTAPGAVVLNFTSGPAGSPFYPANGLTTFGGAVTDPAFNGGSTANFTFANPVTGVGITTPASPNFATAVASTFGSETGGFGVANSGTGRFDNGESFTMTSNYGFIIQTIDLHELQRNETLHISWVSAGVAMSQTFAIDSSNTPGTGLVATFDIPDLTVDPNTIVRFTNVTGAGTSDSGRLRFQRMSVALNAVPEPTTAGLLGLLGAGFLAFRRRKR